MRSSVTVPPMIALATLLAACAGGGPCPPPASATAGPPPPDWHDAISDNDHVRIRDWRKSFVAALDVARKGGHGAEIDAAGPLLDPDIALDGVTLPDGPYRCRTIKLGNRAAGHPSYLALPAYPCIVKPSDTLTRLTQTEGPQRPTGRLYPDSSSRLVFLGVMVLGDEAAPIRYGRDDARDLAGAVQRVGDRRWRLLLPDPAWESTMDVMEITPAR